MQTFNTHSSATKVGHVQRHWWHVRVMFACMLVLIVFTCIFGLQASMGQPGSQASNDPPWPAPSSIHIIASSISYGE